MTQLESSKTPLARAYPLIIDSIEELERYAAEAQRQGMNEDNVVVVIYRSAVQMSRRFTLDSTDNRLRLAGVLTADDHKTAKLQLRQPQAFAYEDEHVIEDDLVLEDFLPQLADHEDGETDETSDHEREVEMAVEEEDQADPPKRTNPW